MNFLVVSLVVYLKNKWFKILFLRRKEIWLLPWIIEEQLEELDYELSELGFSLIIVWQFSFYYLIFVGTSSVFWHFRLMFKCKDVWCPLLPILHEVDL